MGVSEIFEVLFSPTHLIKQRPTGEKSAGVICSVELTDCRRSVGLGLVGNLMGNETRDVLFSFFCSSRLIAPACQYDASVAN